jgi:hypothetical protein
MGPTAESGEEKRPDEALPGEILSVDAYGALVQSMFYANQKGYPLDLMEEGLTQREVIVSWIIGRKKIGGPRHYIVPEVLDVNKHLDVPQRLVAEDCLDRLPEITSDAVRNACQVRLDPIIEAAAKDWLKDHYGKGEDSPEYDELMRLNAVKFLYDCMQRE